MRRPLFWVCLFLVLVSIVQLCVSGALERRKIIRDTLVDPQELREREVRFAGRVEKKEIRSDATYVWVEIFEKVHSEFSDHLTDQIISCMKQMKTNKIRCRMSSQAKDDEPRIGSVVLVEGFFSFCTEATNPGEFNAAAYYQGEGVGGILYETKLLSVGAKYNLTKELLGKWREYWAHRLDQIFPQKEAGVMKAMLLGDKTDLDGELKSLYRSGGILHILSISGLHVSLLGMGIFRLLRRMGASQGGAAMAGGALLLLYGLMTGMSVSACRAIGMYLLRMLASLWGRTYDLLTALAVMAALMLCVEPLHALQSGFWLSFGALAGVGTVLPVLQSVDLVEMGDAKPGESFWNRLGRFLRETMRDGLRAGAAVYLISLPMLLCFYYEVPVYSMLLNLLVVPWMGVVLGVGFLVMVIPGLGFLGVIDTALLRWFAFLCGVSGKLPFHTWNPGCPGKLRVVCYYGLLFLILWKIWTHKKARKKKLWIFLLVCPGMLFAFPGMFGNAVTFLDVGQGDCACIRTAEGDVYLSDCGSSGREGVGAYVLLPYLKYQGIHRIEGLFLSHADTDHVNGIVELLERAAQEGIAIGHLYLPDLGEERTAAEFEKVLVAARQVPSLQVHQIGAGDRLEGKRYSVEVLSPQRGHVPSDVNQASLCLLMRLEEGKKERKLLLTGDLEGDGEAAVIRELMGKKPCQVDVLKCAHHGSKHATSQAFLDQVDAWITVISCGRHNVYGHPHEETLERLQNDGTRILRTDQSGAICVRWNDEEMRIRTFLF